jgi:hypothetical protein
MRGLVLKITAYRGYQSHLTRERRSLSLSIQELVTNGRVNENMCVLVQQMAHQVLSYGLDLRLKLVAR